MIPLVQVIGFGPASLGLPLAADRMGELDHAGAYGMALVERSISPAVLRAGRFPYLVESNSAACDFIAGIAPAGRFGDVLDRPAGRKLVAHGDRRVPLHHVGEYLADLAEEVADWVRGSRGEIRYGREVRRVRHNADGTFTSLCTADRPVLRSHAVVLATGAIEDAARLGVPGDRLVTSGGVLAGDLDSVEYAIRTGRPVVIVGGSHSGFATADLVLTRCAGAVRPGQITVVHREIALGFTSLAELTAAGPPMPAAPIMSAVVCSETGLVNRFTGLRGPARQLCTAVLAGTEKRVRLCPAGTTAADQAIGGAAVVVHACGYRAAVPELIDADGTPLPLVRDRGNIAVDGACRVLGPHGPIAGVHGLGIGFARRDVSGERRAALNVFHGQDAKDIVKSLLVRASSLRRATTSMTRKGQQHV